MASSLRSMAGASYFCFAIGFLFLGLLVTTGCEASDHLVPETVPQICDECLEFTNQVQMILADPETQRQAVEVVSQMACQSLIPQLKKKCLDAVSVYVPDIFVSLQAHLGPEVCTRAGLCTAISSSDISSSDIPELGRLLGHRHLGKKKMCKFGRRAAFAKSSVKMSDCAFCQFVVLELKLKLRDPVTQEKIIDVLYNGCNRVQNHVDQCKMIVAEYAPFILANLDNILDADSVCVKIGACKPFKYHRRVNTRLDHHVNTAEPVLLSAS